MKPRFFVFFFSLMALLTSACAQSLGALQFDPAKGKTQTLTMPDGSVVRYTAYTHLYYVVNVEDSAYQYLNFFVPEGAGKGSAILMRTYVGGYMASAAGYPQAGDATGRALKEGIVVCIPGTRGRNSTVTDSRGHTVYTGRAPKAILDLKAAVRYLRHFDREMLGTAERIFIDGTSAGGALAALLGTSGNQADYADELRAMGAADERDEVFGAICFCPITDLDHADMAYEWLYNGTDSRRAASASIRKMSAELAAQYPAYLESLKLRTPNGTLLTRDNYLDYVKSEIIRGAQYAKDAGADIPDGIGFSFSPAASFGAPPVNGGTNAQASTRRKRPAGGADIPEEERPARSQQQKERGEYIVDLDMPTYLNYVVGTIALKTAPAFDSEIKTDGFTQKASGENEEFGPGDGSSANFTDYTAALNGSRVSAEVRRNVRMLNPMNYISSTYTTAPYWFIRHGARDRDTSFCVPINLALKLQNAGKSVNFRLAWNRPHSGDYGLDEIFAWMKKAVSNH